MRLILLLLSVLCLSQVSKPSENVIFKIEGTVFDLDTYIIIGKDTAAARKFVTTVFKAPPGSEDFTNRAVTYYERGYPIVTWFSSAPHSIEDMGTVSHECFHIVAGILQWAGVPLTDDTEEVYAFMQDYYFRSILKLSL